jgi:uncharacterized protein (TIGR03435 family)
MPLRYVVTICLLLTVSAPLFATQMTASPGFEAASIKPSNSLAKGSIGFRPGRFSATNVLIRNLIMFAFEVRSFQVVGGPDWINSATWTINATSSPNGLARFPAMVKQLLEDRFFLRSHLEVRQLPIYVLKRARDDGGLGPNLKPFTRECRTAEKPLGVRCSFGVSPNLVRGVGVDWKVLDLARELDVDRIVVDHTGLNGRFELEMKWNSSLPADGAADGAVSIFTALREQLGLKLESSTGPVEVLVIDGVERPTAD